MTSTSTKPALCSIHGSARRRATCSSCNAAYMRTYLRRRRSEDPAFALWERARCRAGRTGISFALPRDALAIPSHCPVLGIPILVGGKRSPNSPSLDRIRPDDGYVPGNVRIISDQANRLKGDRTHGQLRHRARFGRRDLRADFAKVAAYVERETLLAEVRRKATCDGRAGAEWQKIAKFLDHAFQRGPPA